MVAGDTTVRDVRLSAEPATGGWAVKSLAATLPGRTTLEADGMLRTEGDLGFTGSLLLAIGQPSGFAAWVSQDVDDAIRRLPAAGFRAKVDLTQERQAFSDLELGLGNATFRGEAERRQPSDAKPATVLKLAGGALDVDGLAAFVSLFVSDVGVNRFADGDLDLEVKAGPVSAAGLTAQSVDTALRLREGLLEIDRLSIGDLAGATVSATGTIRDFPDNPSGNIDASLVAVDLAPLIAAAAERYRDNVLVQGLQARAVGLSRTVRGCAARHRGDRCSEWRRHDRLCGQRQRHLQAAPTLSATLSGNGQREQAADADDLDRALRPQRRRDRTARALRPPGPAARPDRAGRDQLFAQGQAVGRSRHVVQPDGGDFSTGFAGTARLADGGIAAKGKARLNAADIEPWLMTTSVALPAMGAGLAVELEADADYGDELLVLDGLTGTVNEGCGRRRHQRGGQGRQAASHRTADPRRVEPRAAGRDGARRIRARKHRKRLVFRALRAESFRAVQRRTRRCRRDAVGRAGRHRL